MAKTAVTCGVSSDSSSTTSPVGPAYLSLRRTSLTFKIDFPFHSDKEKQALIALTTGDEPQGEALDALNMPDLFKRLAPYICGFVRQAAPPAPARERIFTRTELKRCIYPEIGMYCEIDGDVYDLGRKGPFQRQ
jgi:hypothetical protein